MTPYSDLPATAFWRPSVAEIPPEDVAGLWSPKFAIRPEHRIATAGSCFAQHFSAALVARGYRWLDAEPAPPLMKETARRAFNYGVFSFRTGNIYTLRMLRQWLRWAVADAMPQEVWQAGGRYFDPFRPAIEPGGFDSLDDLRQSRRAVLAAIRRAVDEADVLVFTLGLTESWRNRRSGIEYPMCPGTAAGTFDAAEHAFHNHRADDIWSDLRGVLALLARRNRTLRLLLTVSPVPLTATASGRHVLTATTYSKSVLRCVAGQAAEDLPQVDYFPSYEIITGTPFRGRFYADNLRSVLPEGVAFVMDSFFRDQARVFGAADDAAVTASPVARKRTRTAPAAPAGKVICEEAMLDAFAR